MMNQASNETCHVCSYDGDGKRVKSVLTTNVGSTTTHFVGTHYEVTGSEVTKYYYAGSQRIAMRQDDELFFIIGDHLGSTSLVTNASGVVISSQHYKAWGEIRYSIGTEQTKYTYTGQYSYTSDFGLHFYNARWYDSSLSRFAQADTITPNGVQGYDRYAYVNNNPLKYQDPSGHVPIDCSEESYCKTTPYKKTLKTYSAAGISVQNPSGIIRDRKFTYFLKSLQGENGEFSGIGPAKVTDKQMETPYGEIVTDEGQRRGVGLGLRLPGSCSTTCYPDQLDMSVAMIAMETRISLRTNICQNNGCTQTDIYIVAALAQNESIYPGDVRNALKNYPASGGPTSIDWRRYLEEADPNNYNHNQGLIISFTVNVLELAEQGAYVPQDIDWTYIAELSNPHHSP